MINYESEEEIIQKGSLELEKLLLNFLGNEKLLIVNDDNSLTAVGTEEEIRMNKPAWCNYLVCNISYNKEAELIQINISKE